MYRLKEREPLKKERGKIPGEGKDDLLHLFSEAGIKGRDARRETEPHLSIRHYWYYT